MQSERRKYGTGRSLVYPEIDSPVIYPMRLPIWMKEQLREKYGRDAPGLIRELLVRHAGLKRPENN